ncbi:MAG: hypothetical protein K5Q68_26085 [Roseococcus sp.]|nr:hypothetical protein [Roseococcus sp.]
MAGLILPLAEAWLPAFLLAAGLTLGALVALALGHLLAEAWLQPLRPPLAAMARAAPVLLLLALPLLLAMPALYPWAAAPEPRDWSLGWYQPLPFGLRSLAGLLLWSGLGWVLARPEPRRRTAGAALILLVLSGALLMEDWALSRDQCWTGSLQGLALVIEQIGAAIALAALLALRQGMPEDAARMGLERALLTLGMMTLWLWFVQYVVVYAANLPQEAAWYLRRADGLWGWVKLAVALPALLGAIGLALVPQWARWRLVAVCLLLLVQHVAHLAWVVRPDAALVGGVTSGWADALVSALVLLPLVLAWRLSRRMA